MAEYTSDLLQETQAAKEKALQSALTQIYCLIEVPGMPSGRRDAIRAIIDDASTKVAQLERDLYGTVGA